MMCTNILFSDEAHFHLNGHVNKQNWNYWSATNPKQKHQTPLNSPWPVTKWHPSWRIPVKPSQVTSVRLNECRECNFWTYIWTMSFIKNKFPNSVFYYEKKNNKLLTFYLIIFLNLNFLLRHPLLLMSGVYNYVPRIAYCIKFLK